MDRPRFEISWCELCKAWQTRCPECGMGGCSGGHFPDCGFVEEELRVSAAIDLLLGKTNLAQLLDKTR